MIMKKIANTLNEHFIHKVEELKKNIDPKMVEDPLKRLEKQMKNNKSVFSIKQIIPSCIVAVTSRSSYLARKGEEHWSKKTQTYTTPATYYETMVYYQNTDKQLCAIGWVAEKNTQRLHTAINKSYGMCCQIHKRLSKI